MTCHSGHKADRRTTPRARSASARHLGATHAKAQLEANIARLHSLAWCPAGAQLPGPRALSVAGSRSPARTPAAALGHTMAQMKAVATGLWHKVHAQLRQLLLGNARPGQRSTQQPLCTAPAPVGKAAIEASLAVLHAPMQEAPPTDLSRQSCQHSTGPTTSPQPSSASAQSHSSVHNPTEVTHDRTRDTSPRKNTGNRIRQPRVDGSQ